MELTHNFQHIEITDNKEVVTTEDTAAFITNITWTERADLRLILKAASQSAAFTHQERDLALRLIGELDQLPLEF